MSSNRLYTKLFRGQPGEPGEAERMDNIVAEFPYFSLAHLYLLQETNRQDPSYSRIAAMSAMHFQHPFLLQYRLSKKDSQQEASAVFSSEQETSSKKKTEHATISTGELLINKMTEQIAPKLQESTPGMDEVSVEAIKSTGTEPVSSEAAPVDKPEEKEPLLFEPLHTTDYFASQGIKLSEEMQSADKLGKQLKSFTEWLKTMKKVQAQKKQEEIQTPIDPAVEHMAEKSNKEEDVITETMAEVFTGQGKKKRAIEIYEKLLLQNPSKSAYFAAKIDSLKES